MPAIEVFDDIDGVVRAARSHFERCFVDAVAARGTFTVALAGGSSPERLYASLAEEPQRLPWNRGEVFLSDERWVPSGAPESNLGMVRRTLLDHVDATVHAPEIGSSPEETASAYSERILNVLGDPPEFDLILLGMGEDGHTASLFPGKSVLHSRDWCVAAPHGALKPAVPRISFTFPLILRAKSVLLCATGASKAKPMAQWRDGASTTDELPVTGLDPLGDRLRVLVDRPAAKDL